MSDTSKEAARRLWLRQMGSAEPLRRKPPALFTAPVLLLSGDPTCDLEVLDAVLHITIKLSSSGDSSRSSAASRRRSETRPGLVPWPLRAFFSRAPEAAEARRLANAPGGSMPQFMLQFSYTPAAWAALSKNPVDRSEAIAAMSRQLGGRFVSLHYTMGEHDGVAVIEAPDDTTANAIVVAAIS